MDSTTHAQFADRRDGPPESRLDGRPATALPLPARAAVALEASHSLDGAVGLARRVTAPLRRNGLRQVFGGEWMGHALHPSLTDLPLGFWTSAAALDVLGGPAARPAARRLVGLGLLAAAPTAASGWTEWQQADRPAQRVGVVHAGLNVAAVGLFYGSWLARRRGRFATGAALGLAGTGLTGVAGYLGAHLTSVRRVSTRHPGFDSAASVDGDPYGVGSVRRDPTTLRPGAPAADVTDADVTAAVTAQHARVAQLLQDVGLAPRDERQARLDRLLAYLAGHEAVEEELLHPHATFDSAEAVGPARMREESSVGEQIKRLEDLGPHSEVFGTQLALIEEAIVKHAQAEEDEELPRLAKTLGRQDAALVVEAFELLARSSAGRHGPFVRMLEQARAEVRELAAAR